ncbi:MAG: ABC transporter substrate-binding protein [Anaerolineae bacterium]
MSKTEKLSRRKFLQWAALSSAGALLASCAPAAPEEDVEVETEPGGGVASGTTPDKKEVRIVRCGWLESEMPVDLAIATYNNLEERQTDNVEIILDPAGKAPTDQVLGQMMASGEDVPWNSHVCFTPFLETNNAISLETIQPFDPFIESSTYSEAAQRVKDDMIGSVRSDNSYEGQLYAIPTNIDVVCFQWRQDYLDAVGVDVPQTMDEVVEAAIAVTEGLQDEQVFGFAPTPAVTWRYIAALHQAYSPPEDLFTEEGLLNILDEGWIQAMEVTKEFIDANTVPDGWETWGYPEAWRQGKIAMAITQHSNGTWGGMIWGYDKLAMGPTPLGNPELDQAGTMFWATSMPLYKTAPYPQETTDFLVWMVDPDNELWNTGALEAGKMLGFASAYEKYVDPEDVTLSWAIDVLPLLEAATPPPPTKWYITEHNAIVPRFVEYLQGEKPAEQAMQEALDEIEAEMAAG